MTNIVSDQKEFFNLNALDEKVYERHKIFSDYVNKEQREGLKWLGDSKRILEYGCGTGTSIDIFSEVNGLEDYEIIGVDIAENAITKIRENYPSFAFYKIENNRIPQVADGSLDAVYMFHVLHHSKRHEDIFFEVARILKPGGKFLINDLTSRNPIIKLGRLIFGSMGANVWGKFGDDLVVEGKIPEKYKLDIGLIEKQLNEAGFVITRKSHGHLFFFVFAWLDKFVKLTQYKPILAFYRHLVSLEGRILRHRFFSQFAEVISFECVKNA